MQHISKLITIKKIKNILLCIVIGICFISCKKEEQTIDSVELYYKGRTVIHSTFNVPLKFYANGKLVLEMLLWSLDSTLESGRYTLCPDKPSGGWSEKGNINKTFSREHCFWNGRLIKDGYIDVNKYGNKYTFHINLIDVKGKQLITEYSGNIANKTSSTITPYLGFFNSFSLEKTKKFVDGKATDVFIVSARTGDWLSVYYREIHIFFRTESMTFPEGYHSIKDTETYPAYLYREQFCGQQANIVSGSFSITPTSSYPPYRLDMDITTEDGEHILGNYINGELYSVDPSEF